MYNTISNILYITLARSFIVTSSEWPIQLPHIQLVNETRSTTRENIFGVNLSARILQGRWEICHCTQAYAGTWNFMCCSVSINPSLQRALRPRFVLGACQAGIYVPVSFAYICTRSLAVLFSITSIPAQTLLPILPHEIRLSHLSHSTFFPTLCRTCGIILAITWYFFRIIDNSKNIVGVE